MDLYHKYGSAWARIAEQLPGGVTTPSRTTSTASSTRPGVPRADWQASTHARAPLPEDEALLLRRPLLLLPLLLPLLSQRHHQVPQQWNRPPFPTWQSQTAETTIRSLRPGDSSRPTLDHRHIKEYLQSGTVLSASLRNLHTPIFTMPLLQLSECLLSARHNLIRTATPSSTRAGGPCPAPQSLLRLDASAQILPSSLYPHADLRATQTCLLHHRPSVPPQLVCHRAAKPTQGWLSGTCWVKA